MSTYVINTKLKNKSLKEPRQGHRTEARLPAASPTHLQDTKNVKKKKFNLLQSKNRHNYLSLFDIKGFINKRMMY